MSRELKVVSSTQAIVSLGAGQSRSTGDKC